MRKMTKWLIFFKNFSNNQKFKKTKRLEIKNA